MKADVLNVIPEMRAGTIARTAGLTTLDNRWCEVDFLTFESVAQKNVHVLGDSIQGAPGMPKSGHMANQHGKTCGCRGGDDDRARGSLVAGLCQHLLQLRDRRRGGTRGECSQLQRREKDHVDGARLGWPNA